jgi:hypothetical protein
LIWKFKKYFRERHLVKHQKVLIPYDFSINKNKTNFFLFQILVKTWDVTASVIGSDTSLSRSYGEICDWEGDSGGKSGVED